MILVVDLEFHDGGRNVDMSLRLEQLRAKIGQSEARFCRHESMQTSHVWTERTELERDLPIIYVRCASCGGLEEIYRFLPAGGRGETFQSGIRAT